MQHRVINAIALAVAIASFSCCEPKQSAFDPASVPDAAPGQVVRVEPLCWWVRMKTPLQLLVGGDGISSWEDVRFEGGKGVEVTAVHKADSPNYLFVDVAVSSDAVPGTYYLVFTKDGASFKVPYEIGARREGSAQRKSFTTADLIYLVFPDRFANGDPSNDIVEGLKDKTDRDDIYARHGGDIQGIVDHLDYIADLGATAIWSTPLLLDDQPRESYHGYACCDYYHIDPRFGTNELYCDFVRKAHTKGLKVIMDIVTNHCGTEHWWMKDMPFKDWVHVFPEYTGTNVDFSANMDPNASKYDLNLQESGWFVPSMPDMNLDNPYVLRYFQQWAVWWIEYADLDGLRVDTYPYNEKEPMSRWCASVLDEYPDMNIVGECWTSSYSQLAYWQGGNPNKDGFDSHLPSIMDFPLEEAMVAAICEGGDDPGWGRGMVRVYDCLSHDFLYHDLSKMMTFFANHDHSRMGDTFDHDPRKMKIALALLATIRGIPQLYNGDEMMFSCKKGSWHDGAKRIDFPGGWKEDRTDLFTAQGRASAGKTADVDYTTAADLHDYTSRLFNWRKDTPVLHNGRTLHFLGRDNTYAFFRYCDDSPETVFVFVNNTDKSIPIPWDHYAEFAAEKVEGTDVATGEAITLEKGLVTAPRTALVVQYRR